MSPKTKFHIAFWSVTIPLIPIVTILALIGIILAAIPSFRDPALNRIERWAKQICDWRNNVPIVKNSYRKMNLFNYIKHSHN